MSPRLAVWTVRVAAAFLGTGALVAIALGVVLLVQDASRSGGPFAGLGLVLGLMACGIGAALLTVSGLVLWLARRSTRTAAALVCAFGTAVAALGALVTSAAGVSLAGLLVVGGLFLAGLGFGAALGAPEVAIDSPGGDTQ